MKILSKPTVKLGSKGFTHLMIAAIIVVVGIAAFGTYQYVKSSALVAGSGGSGSSKLCTPQRVKNGECPAPPKGPQ
jgi:hypothetical protein